MSRKKIVTVIGARPQFVKASVVSAALALSQQLTEVVVHTGQHFDANMSDVFFAELGMAPPAYHFDIHGGGHGEMTGRMLTALEQVLFDEKPDAVMVYGDTNSTLAGALAAIKLRIPVAHVEAGMRSFNLASPEEINRILTDRVARWLFASTESAAAHMRREGLDSDHIHVVGDVMFDVALHHGSRARPDDGLLAKLTREYGVQAGDYCLATIHRAENTDYPARLDVIIEALINVAKDLPVVLPLHPRTRSVLVQQARLAAVADSLILLEPLSYLDMVQLEHYAALIATDSGGVQKEAFFYRVPCVTLRDDTEWMELVDAGWNRLAPPTNATSVTKSLFESIGSAGAQISPYGDGAAAARIVQQLSRDLS